MTVIDIKELLAQEQPDRLDPRVMRQVFAVSVEEDTERALLAHVCDAPIIDAR